MAYETTFYVGAIKIVRYDLESKTAPRNFISKVIAPLWRKYEPWSSYDDIQRSISVKPGRRIDLAFSTSGEILGFYIFRVFQHEGWKIMFRGNSYSDTNVRGVGAALLKSTVRQYHPDKIVTFTSEERVYVFLSYFGDILPAFNKKLLPEEMELMSRLAGCKHTIEADTMIVKNFYQEQHIKQGGAVRDKNIRDLFAKLNYRDAYALLIRVY